jgi:hypothetical protein
LLVKGTGNKHGGLMATNLKITHYAGAIDGDVQR